MSLPVKLPTLPLWSQWPAEKLREEKAASPRAFARGRQMRAFTDEEVMFPSFKSCFNSVIRAADVARRGWPTFIGVDLAGEKRKGNVIFVGAMDPGTQHRYPVEIMAGAWTSPETARRLHEAHGRHPNTRCILVETNAYQAALVDWIKHGGGASGANWWWKVESFTTGSNKANLTVGLPSLELEFHHKMWSIPESEFAGHPVECKCPWCTWVEQMTDYPMSAADDTVMGCWFFREAISRWGGGGATAVKGMVGPSFNSR